MLYRVAKFDDLKDLARLHAESWRESYRGIFSDEFLDNDVWCEREQSWSCRLSSPKYNQHVLIATDNNIICGFICAFGHESTKWGTLIDNLHVSKEYKGKGIGKKLMHLVALWADESFDHKGVYLEVLEDNLDARQFYQNIGAKHQETNLWKPPGTNEQVVDLLYVWDNNITLLDMFSNKYD